MYRAAAWAVLVRMYCDTVVVAVAVAIGMDGVCTVLESIAYVVCMLCTARSAEVDPPQTCLKVW